ncbi:NADH:ubiquinone reductase (Na(+)-transporting) subunit B [Falsiporphyromonas endometrii]|uniref:Na(+)-translocating NADH-quinone reductase subunit B n=1 Tax=Falsiporphyromonas endometrii TaxID=1387297 RepID=A0ABV9KA10_9PORP|nr:NADH:ubiquinone reductase (Na(+)-transporting) subunit B [Porphyromonadaceae bacterium]
MKGLRKKLNEIKPNFEEGGKFSAFRSVFEGLETFLYVPNTTSKTGVHVHDAIDSKRTMTVVILALMPALLFGMYNVGYQHYLAIGESAGFWALFGFGFLAVLPKIVVSYVVGLGIEFVAAQKKREEIQEGFLVTGMLIPMIVPVDTPLWMIAVATAMAVIFAKEVFGGTGYNIVNVALVTRAILFFAYPSKMSGDSVFVRTADTFGMGSGQAVDAFSGATPLGQIAVSHDVATPIADQLHNIVGQPLTMLQEFIGLIPGSIGETSKLCILIGAVILIWTGIASWKIMVSGVVGASVMAWIFNAVGSTASMMVSPLQHILLGGFLFGLVFMATDPVTSARTETGKWIYGFLVGVMAVFIRVLNPGYPEGMMLAILFMNVFAPLIDYFVVDANIKRRLKRAQQSANAK